MTDTNVDDVAETEEEHDIALIRMSIDRWITGYQNDLKNDVYKEEDTGFLSKLLEDVRMEVRDLAPDIVSGAISGRQMAAYFDGFEQAFKAQGKTEMARTFSELSFAVGGLAYQWTRN